MGRLFLALIFGSICVVSTQELYLRHVDGALILPIDLLRRAEWMAGQERWAETRMLSGFVVDHAGTGDVQQARALLTQADEQIHSLLGSARRFAHGAVTGEPTDTAGLLGSLSLDLFVVGDIRDLVVQGWKEWRYDDGDTVILALSGVGLATTLAPQIDWAPALLKVFRRLGRLSTEFTRRLKAMSSAALRTGDIKPLVSTVDDFGTAARHLGPGPLAGIMRQIDSPEALSSIADAARVDAGGTYVLVSAFGRNGVALIERSASGVHRLTASIRAGSRVAKLGKKSLGTVPSGWLAGLALLSLAAFATALPGVRGIATRMASRRRRPARDPDTSVLSRPPPEAKP